MPFGGPQSAKENPSKQTRVTDRYRRPEQEQQPEDSAGAAELSCSWGGEAET